MGKLEDEIREALRWDLSDTAGAQRAFTEGGQAALTREEESQMVMTMLGAHTQALYRLARAIDELNDG